MRRMRIIGLAGWSGSGKTTLLTKVIPRLDRARAQRSRRSSTRITASTSTSRARIRTRHRMAGATEVLVGSANRWALMHELRGDAGADLRGAARRSSRRSIWCWSRASSASAHPEARGLSRRGRQAAAASGRSGDRRDRRPTSRCRRRACRWSISTTSRRSPTCCCAHAAPLDARAGARAERADGAAHRRLLRVLRAAAAGRRGRAADRRARHAGRRDRDRAARRRRAGACSRADVVAPIDLPPFDNSAVDGYAVRHADLDAARRDAPADRRARDRRPRRRRARSAPARRSASSPARRCRPAPTPCSCRRTCAPRATP